MEKGITKRVKGKGGRDESWEEEERGRQGENQKLTPTAIYSDHDQNTRHRHQHHHQTRQPGSFVRLSTSQDVRESSFARQRQRTQVGRGVCDERERQIESGERSRSDTLDGR